MTFGAIKNPVANPSVTPPRSSSSTIRPTGVPAIRAVRWVGSHRDRAWDRFAVPKKMPRSHPPVHTPCVSLILERGNAQRGLECRPVPDRPISADVQFLRDVPSVPATACLPRERDLAAAASLHLHAPCFPLVNVIATLLGDYRVIPDGRAFTLVPKG